jgi:hypothetical protein
MRFRISVVALLACAFATSCDRPQPATATPAGAPPPTTSVATFDGFQATHDFRDDVDLATFLRSLPCGSVDHLDSTHEEPYVIAVVQVSRSAAGNVVPASDAPVEFETSFRGKGDAGSVMRWKPASGNNSGTWTAVFVLPESVDQGQTRLAPQGVEP